MWRSKGLHGELLWRPGARSGQSDGQSGQAITAGHLDGLMVKTRDPGDSGRCYVTHHR